MSQLPMFGVEHHRKIVYFKIVMGNTSYLDTLNLRPMNDPIALPFPIVSVVV